MLIFVGQRPKFSPNFFASSFRVFVSIFFITSLNFFCSLDCRRVIYIGKNKVNFLVLYRNNNLVTARISRLCFLLLVRCAS